LPIGARIKGPRKGLISPKKNQRPPQKEKGEKHEVTANEGGKPRAMPREKKKEWKTIRKQTEEIGAFHPEKRDSLRQKGIRPRGHPGCRRKEKRERNVALTGKRGKTKAWMQKGEKEHDFASERRHHKIAPTFGKKKKPRL